MQAAITEQTSLRTDLNEEKSTKQQVEASLTEVEKKMNEVEAALSVEAGLRQQAEAALADATQRHQVTGMLNVPIRLLT